MIARRLAVLASLTVLTAAGTPADAAVAPTPTPVVATTLGAVQGVVVDGIAAFKGIPYGAPPIGARRFLPPQPATPWKDVLDATAFGAPAMQMYDRPLNGSALGLQLATVFPTRSAQKIDNEDCLYLNLWTPAADAGKRPVMVWLHGGGYAYGSGSWPVYDGVNLARKGDVVVVSLNHRLNVFGYLDLVGVLGDAYAQSGNAGMLDIVQALAWVRDNVAAFGGDPGNVTIMGESGGGSKVSTLLAMPAASGLFHKAIIQSGPGLTGVAKVAAAKVTHAILAELGLDAESADSVRAALKTLPADTILAAAYAAQAKAGPGFGSLPLAPVVDGAVLPNDPFTPGAPAQAKDIPVVIGWNKDEMALFNTTTPWFGKLTDADLPSRFADVVGGRSKALLAAYRKLYPDYSPTYLYNMVLSDNFMFRGSVLIAERKAAQRGAPVYVYNLVWETPVGNGVFKSPHTLDIPFMFANVDKAIALTGDSDAARRLELQMSSTWIAFARTGDPNNATIPNWPAYDAKRRATLTLDVSSKVVDDPKREVRRILTGR